MELAYQHIVRKQNRQRNSFWRRFDRRITNVYQQFMDMLYFWHLTGSLRTAIRLSRSTIR
jgi:hypothetical protein